MGNDYGNVDSYDFYQYVPFAPIFFAPKAKEDGILENAVNSSYLSTKFSSLSKSDSPKEKNTLEDEKNFDKIELNKNCGEKNFDKYKNIFTKLKDSPMFESKNIINNYDLDDYYLNFEENDNIRKSYYSKLIYKNKWSFGLKPKTHNNLFIFDWDDTILPTSFLRYEKIINDENIPEEYAETFSIIEKVIIKILKLAINKGDVYIITNSSVGWVEYSAVKYYPKIKDILNKIRIISARNEYENDFPGQLKIWKQKTFLSLKKILNENIPSNIICFGDSIIELEAGKNLASNVNNSFIKTIKFRTNPEPDDLIKELNLVYSKFNYIYSKAKDLSIRIEQKL
jgi:hypothetical protein